MDVTPGGRSPVVGKGVVDLEHYRDHLYGVGLSTNTVRNYELRVRQAARWCLEHETNLFEITPTQIVAMLATWPASHTTRGQIRAALKYWWEMMGRPKPPVGAIPLPPTTQGFCRAVEPEQARALVKTALNWRPQGLAVLVGLYLALRSSEIAGMEWARYSGDLYRVTGKGEVTADLPVHPVMQGELNGTRRVSEWVFPGRLTGHVRPQTVWNWTQEVATEAGVGNIRVHDLRHTCLAEMHDRTGDLRTTSKFARHAKLQTTERYTRTTQARLTEAVLSLDYLA